MTPKTQVDSGWAWVVLAATAGSMFLNGILVYFVGVVHAGLLRKYQESIAATAWVGGLYTSLMMLGAPVGSYLIGRIGCRKTSVIGGLFLTIGLSSSAFVTSIGQLFITYGCIAGMGLALTYTPAVLTIGFYFDKLRGLASGLSASAAALGILSGSLIMQILIDQFSVSGAFLIMGALTLHHCFFGMFYRPTVFEGGHDSWVEKDEENVIHSAECVPQSELKTAASAPLLSSVDFEREEPESEKRTSNPLEKIIQREAPDSEKINERVYFARSRESFDREETLYRKELVLTNDVELHAVATAQIQSSPRNKISSLQEIDGGREPSFSQSSTVFYGLKTGEYMSKELTVNSDRAAISEDEASPAVTGNASLISDNSESSVIGEEKPLLNPQNCLVIEHGVTPNGTQSENYRETEKITQLENMIDEATSNVKDKSSSNRIGKSTSNVTDKSTSNVTDKSTSNVTDKSTSNVTDKSTSNVTDKSTSNVTDKSTSNVTDKSTSNVTDKSTSNVTDKSTSNVTDKSTSNVTDKSTSNLVYKSTSNNNSSSKCGATLSVLKNSGFFCYALSQLALCVTSSGVFLHLPEYVQHHGTSPTAAAALFVAVGVSSMCARLATGFMTTDERIDPLMIQMGITGLCGLVTVLFPLYSDSYGGQVAFSAMFGFYTGGSVSLYSVVIVRFVGVRLLTAAFGILLFSMGVGNIAGPPVAAVVVDLGGTYEQSFVFLGLVMEVSFLLHLAAGYFLKPRSDAESKEVEVVHGDFMGSAVVISAAPSSLHVSSELA
ncbi:uncharacterized protein [Littorina saxatilis]|uniref:Major facilitator superfamily (MFS) profile domain-containing protein n=2 Tax=Littorina saxatilis TaxID=31220 RepID=A0AAN9AQ18_9CAEN